MMEKAKSGIQLRSVFLKKSSLERSQKLTNQNMRNSKMGINVACEIEGNLIHSTVSVEIKHQDETTQEIDFSIQVTMTGEFERIQTFEEFSLDDNEFGRINAPSIVYPYIRQHVRALTLDAGINPIILPVINFVKLYEEG